MQEITIQDSVLYDSIKSAFTQAKLELLNEPITDYLDKIPVSTGYGAVKKIKFYVETPMYDYGDWEILSVNQGEKPMDYVKLDYWHEEIFIQYKCEMDIRVYSVCAKDLDSDKKLPKNIVEGLVEYFKIYLFARKISKEKLKQSDFDIYAQSLQTQLKTLISILERKNIKRR